MNDYPNDCYGLFQHANILLLLGNLDDAEKEFKYIIENEFENKFSAIYKLGIISFNRNDLDKAYEYFKYNVENSPYQEDTSIKELSNIELERGNYEEAYNVLTRYSDMKNDYIILQAIYILRIQEKYSEAYELILNHDMSENILLKGEYYRIRGIVERALEKYEEAEESFNKALGEEKNDTYYKTKIEMAHLYFEQCKYQEASNICLDILNINQYKYMENIMIILGNICQKTFHYDQAKKYYLESVDYKKSTELKGYFYAANVCMIKKEYDQAKEYYDKYLETINNPINISKVNLKKALIAAKTDNLEELEENINKIDSKYLKEIDLEDYKNLKIHISYKKGNSLNEKSYRQRQMNHYSLSELKEHIDKEHQSYNGKEICVFNGNVDFEKLICEIPYLLSKAERTANHYYERYRVHYPNIGYVNGKPTDTLELIVFAETNNVLTMFPVKKFEYQPEKSKEKCKRKTQIEKFNQRYENKSE